MSTNASHTITLPLSSALLEALASIVFELLLLGLLAILAQLVCAHYNLRRLYDLQQPVKIGSPILPLRVHAPIGHLPLSVALAFLLLLAALMNNVLSFAINGRSEPRYVPTTYPTLVTADPHSRPIPVDFTTEFQPRLQSAAGDADGDAGGAPSKDQKTPRISARLRALRLVDQCTECDYTHCSVFAYVLTQNHATTELVDPDENFPSVCVRQEFFEAEDRWLRYARFGEELSPTIPDASSSSARLASNLHAQEVANDSFIRNFGDLSLNPLVRQDACTVTDIDATFESDSDVAFADAKLTTTECNVDVRTDAARCFRRPNRKPMCASIVTVPEGGLKVLMAELGGEGNGTGAAQNAKIAWVTNGHLMDESNYTLFASTVAYMAALDLSDSLDNLQRMAIADLRAEVVLNRRREDDELVSDVDLRIALPGVVYNVLLLLALAAFDSWLYYSAVWSKQRQGYNTLASVPDVLYVLTDDSNDRRRVEADKDAPGISIQVAQPSLGVSRSRREDALERRTTLQGVSPDDWDEIQIS